MQALVTVLVTLISTLVGSAGFWAYMSKRDVVKSATTRLIMGLAYDKITHIGMKYIERGWVTKDEYEDFQKYLYEPYKELGGNGVGERIMLEVSKLPLKHHSRYADIVQAVHANREAHKDDESRTGTRRAGDDSGYGNGPYDQ